MRASRTHIRRLGMILTLLAVVASSTGFAWSSSERFAEAIVIPGTSRRVQLVRDSLGVPLIRARTENDAQFGLGYAHAQDRLWQLEYQRRLANGRLAEVVGEAGLKTDLLFRTIGLHRTAAAAWANLKPAEQQPIEAYVAGINAYIANRPSQQLPPEFNMLGIAPQPWTPQDVLAWNKVTAWALSSNWDRELLRAQLLPRFGPAKVAQLMPAYTANGPTTMTQAAVAPEPPDVSVPPANLPAIEPTTLTGLIDLQRTIAEQTGLGADGRGSNAWVLSGTRTQTGLPLLANDPHLTTQTPSIWYLARLSYENQRVGGATFPGAPGVQIGNTGDVAWGVTNMGADNQDLYIERVNERGEAEYQGGWEPLKLVPETIAVKGQPDRTIMVRISRHGPLISDVVNPAGPPLALRWTGNDPVDSGVLAPILINRVRSAAEVVAVMRDYRLMDQNVVYADKNGNIGYIAAGTIPLRANGDGTLPVPGWTGEYEWQGYMPFDQLPQITNPEQGYIVTANNKVTNDERATQISSNYAAPYRAARIIEMIEAKPRLNADDMATMQADVLALHARRLLPILLQTSPADERGRQALDLLRGWDARATGDSTATAIFEAWYIRIAQRLFADELGDDVWQTYSRNSYMVAMALEAALYENSPFCDDVRTPAPETCADTLAAALSDGLADMATAQGNADIATWRWDRVHRAQFPHVLFGSDPQQGPFFNRSIPNGGDKFTVNVASSFRRWNDYDQTHAAEYRQIVDFRDQRRSRFITVPGQSGDPNSPHYDDLLKLWQQVEYLQMRPGYNAQDGTPREQPALQP